MADNTQITTEPKKVEQSVEQSAQKPVEQPAPDGVELSADDVQKSGVDVPQAAPAPAMPTTTFAPLSKRELRQKEREARRANRKAQREQEREQEQTEDGSEEEKPEEDKKDDKIALSDYSAVGDASGDNGGSGAKTGGGGNGTFTTEQTTDDNSGDGGGSGSTPAAQSVVRATTTPTSTDTSTKVVKGASQEQQVAIDPDASNASNSENDPNASNAALLSNEQAPAKEVATATSVQSAAAENATNDPNVSNSANSSTASAVSNTPAATNVSTGANVSAVTNTPAAATTTTTTDTTKLSDSAANANQAAAANQATTVKTDENISYDDAVATLDPKAADYQQQRAALDARYNKTLTQAEAKEKLDAEMGRRLSALGGRLLQHPETGEWYEVNGKNATKVIRTRIDENGNEYQELTIGGVKYKGNLETGEWERVRVETPKDIAEGLVSEDKETRRKAQKEFREWQEKQREEAAIEKAFDNIEVFPELTGDNLRTVLGSGDIMLLQRRLMGGASVLTDMTAEKLLLLLKNKRADEIALSANANGDISEIRLKNNWATQDKVNVSPDGKTYVVPKEECNDYMKEVYLPYHDAKDNQMKFNKSHQPTREHQIKQNNWFYRLSEEGQAEFKKAFPEFFNADGSFNSQHNVDSHEGNLTGKVDAWYLKYYCNADQLAIMGYQVNPNTGNLEPWSPEMSLDDVLDDARIRKEKEFEIKRNQRQKTLAAIGSLVMSIGDTIGTASGLKAADRSKISEMQDTLEKRYFEIKSDYDKRLDALRQEREKARSEREKQRFDLYTNMLDHQQQREIQGVQQAFQAAEAAKTRAFTGTENALNRDLQWRIAQLNWQQKKALAELKSSGGANLANDYKLYVIGGKKYYFPKNQKGVAGNILNSVIEGGWTRDNLARTIAKDNNGDKVLRLLPNSLGETFPDASGDTKLDDAKVVLAISNLLEMKGQEGVDDAAIDKIAAELEKRLVKGCGALSQDLVGAYTSSGENEDDDVDTSDANSVFN